jgi:hypothetical protein
MCSLAISGIVWLSQGKGGGRIVRLQRALGAAQSKEDVALEDEKTD